MNRIEYVRLATNDAIDASQHWPDNFGPNEVEYYRGVLSLIPPFTSEIIATLEADDPDIKLTAWQPMWDRWTPVPDSEPEGRLNWWLGILATHGDQPQPGYRLKCGDAR